MQKENKRLYIKSATYDWKSGEKFIKTLKSSWSWLKP